MRIFLLSFLLLLTGPLMAFNVGPTARSNFGSADKAQEDGEAQAQAPQTSFSATKYDLNRWRKNEGSAPEQPEVDVATTMAVPTLPQTVAKETPVEMPPMVPTTMKKAAPETAVKTMGKPPVEKLEGVSPKNTAQQPAAQEPAVPAEASAAIAQLGQMQEMMKSLGGGASGAGGMPDLSALMGGAKGTQPAKK